MSAAFIASETYQGDKEGYVFRSGDSGPGYYMDDGSDSKENQAAAQKPLSQKQKLKMLRAENEKKREQERLEQEKRKEEKLSRGIPVVASYDTEPVQKKIDEMKLAAAAPVEGKEPKEKKVEEFSVDFEQDKWGLRARLTGGPVLITTVSAGQEGATKNVKVGDRITHVNGMDIEQEREKCIVDIRKGGKATIKFVRVEGQEAQVVGVGGAATSVVQGEEMSAGEVAKMQAMIGAAKSKDTVTINGKKDVQETIEEGVTNNSVVVIANCDGCSFTVTAMCTKLFVQACRNTKVVVHGRIITSTVEAYKCDTIDLEFHTPVGTLQIDMCKKPRIVFPKEEHFHDSVGKKNTSMIVWAGCTDMHVAAGAEHRLDTGFEQVKQEFHDLVEERSQFRIRLEKTVAGPLQLTQEKVVRLENGFFSTMKEKSEFDAKQEATLKALAQSMGITIAKAKPQGIKCKRNEICPHGSGKKFKDCCNRPDGVCTGMAGTDW
eukprot:m.239028 g.239028  ORF g.239028 m.239028 type:complete len:490 (-) comp22513_c19_seq2:40-1509(-)